MPAEVQITELAVTQAKIERGCAGMAAERHQAPSKWRASHQACATQNRTGISTGMRLTSPRCSPHPQDRNCVRDTHMAAHL